MDLHATEPQQAPTSSVASNAPLTAFTTAGVRPLAQWTDFAALGVEAHGFHLGVSDAVVQDALLWQIRSSSIWSAWVALDENAPASRLAGLADGRQGLHQAREAAERLARVRSSLPYTVDGLDLEERLLHFLYLRDGARLHPLRDRNSRLLYRFPLVEALGADEDQAAQLVLALQRRRLLEADAPLDRTRHCRQCSSAHPHYFDVCPHCKSIQIDRTVALHCFTCGHVAPQADFQQDGGLICPQCHTRLRHIGVDYDRPLVQYACADCHHVFIETSVLTRCLDCDAVAAPDELDVRVVAPLRLTARARSAVRQNFLGELDDDPPSGAYLTFGQFRRMLDWAIAASRGIAQGFTVVRVEAIGADGGPSAMEGDNLYRVVDELASRIGELLEDADLRARDAQQNLWLMVPRGDVSGLLRAIADLAPAGASVRILTSTRRLPDPRHPSADAAQLIAEWPRARGTE